MVDFLKQMEEKSISFGDRGLFEDGTGQILSYGTFYELTGRVYAYLKQRDIGREDFVLVCLPRSARSFAAACGVLRAGAAFVIVEDALPADRIAYIRMDCACKLVIDEDVWAQAMACDPLSGYEERDDHSAAFAVYTSGTTGAPKGVVHEYGNIALMIAASPLPNDSSVAHFALCSPLNFVLSAMSALVLIAQGSTVIHIVPFATLKDPVRFHAYLVENAVTFAFLSPLFVKKMAKFLSPLTFCVVGAELASELFCPDFAILNGYTMSEVGFTVASFLIDKPYQTTPVGKPVFDCPIRLVGEDGNDVPHGEKGEIVVWNPYVRGYINLPEKTAAAFENGWYHTGDLGVWDEQGNLVVAGRLDDMAKVNGNRVEPGEIEAVAREALGLGWAAAKVFQDNNRSTVCLYYLGNQEIDAGAARGLMAKRLPYYMLPQFFIPITEVPLTAAGKFNRKALRAPRLDEECAEYRVPENDAQRALCEAFSKVFNVAPIGIGDDFSRLGGDSVDAMEIVVSSGLEGLSVADVLKGKTPEGIAMLYAQHARQEDPDEINALALGKSYPLTADQAATVRLQLDDPTSTMRSIHALEKFDKDVLDMERMAAAIDAAARNHPALMTEIYQAQDGELRQRFSRDILGPVELERMTEAEFAQVRETLVQPFGMIGGPLFRARVFETEEAGYVFIDVHHAVFDGSSNGILMSDVTAAYVGGTLSKDYYPYLLEMQQRADTAAQGDGRASYFEEKYDGGDMDWCRHLAVVGDAKDSPIGTARITLPVTLGQMSQIEKGRGISKNGFFILATALALSVAQDAPDVMLFWSFNGRSDARERSTVGSLRCYLPVALSFGDEMTFDEVCESVNDQISAGIAHCHEPYLDQKQSLLDEGIVRVLYQGAMRTPPKMPGLLGAIPLGRDGRVSRPFINFEINEVGDDIVLTTRYTANSFASNEVDRFTELVVRAVEILVEQAPDAVSLVGGFRSLLK